MVQVKKYYLPPTPLIPNSPQPLLHYTGLTLPSPSPTPTDFYDLFRKNGWSVHWIYRYGTTQRSHYHSGIHECMAVLSGTATIRFGVADTSPDPGDNTEGDAREPGGVEIEAEAGDVFLLPAGTAHKTHDARPEAEFALLTPGDGHGVDAADERGVLDEVRLSGFTMIGAYPEGRGSWDAMTGGENSGEYEKVWTIEKPRLDPVLGGSQDGLCGLWN